jgi:pyruvate formate lyase activating enzyme
VYDREGGSTSCPACGQLVVERNWFQIGHYHLTDDGRCRSCDTPLPGIFAGPPGNQRPHRLPVRLQPRPA